MIVKPVEHQIDTARVPNAPLISPGYGNGLLDVFRKHYLLRLLVRKEIQARYSASFLGLFWSYLQPAVKFSMYFFVIGGVMGLHGEVQLFAIHMFAGFVLVHFFIESFTSGTRSIVRNRSILKKMAMPREMFPVASMLVSAFHVIPGYVILIVFDLFLGWRPDPVGVAAGLLGFAIVMMWGTALALLFSAANVFFRDFGNIVSTLTAFITFSVPMIYPYSMVAARFGDLASYYLLNPIAVAVLLNQRFAWVGATDDPAATEALNMPNNLFAIGAAQLGAALITLVIAQLAFTRLENKFAERL
jgi:ABC-2 type transport system permease protein